MMDRTVFGCRSNCGGQAWPGPSDRSSSAARLIANIFQGTDLVYQRRDSLREAQQAIPPTSHTDSLRFLKTLPEIQPANNTHRPRSGQRFCPIDF
jgi:hypothetical protein